MLRIAVIASSGALAVAASADASRAVVYGVQDDAWLAAGDGDLSGRLTELQRLGVDVYRFTLRWDQVETRDNAYDWAWPRRGHPRAPAHGIAPVVTIWGTPGGRTAGEGRTSRPGAPPPRRLRAGGGGPLPRPGGALGDLERAEPGAVAAAGLGAHVHAAAERVLRRDQAGEPVGEVAGGVTAPRGNTGGDNPVNWIRAMRALRRAARRVRAPPVSRRGPRTRRPGPAAARGARRSRWPTSTAWSARCAQLPGQADLADGYGYQTNPPDRWMGVSLARRRRTRAPRRSAPSRRRTSTCSSTSWSATTRIPEAGRAA